MFIYICNIFLNKNINFVMIGVCILKIVYVDLFEWKVLYVCKCMINFRVFLKLVIR